MKEKWLKVAAIAMAIALVFTIVASNIVSLTAISALKAAKENGGKSVLPDTTAAATDVNATGGETQPVDTNSDTAAVSDTQAGVTNSGGTGTNTNGTAGTTKKAGTTSSTLSTKVEILAFYKAAVNKVKLNGAAGYTKKEWQALPELDIGTLGDIINPFIDDFMTPEAEAEEQVSAKGSKEAKDRFPQCTLTDLSKIVSATCKPSGNNYIITIIMADEANPKKTNNFLGKITNSVLYEEDIRETVDGLKVGSINLVSEGYVFNVTYKAFKITATISKDGKFVAMDHYANVPITADAKILKVKNLEGTARLENFCKYYNFKY